MAKDDILHIRIDGDLKKAAQQYAEETGRSLAGLVEYLLRQEMVKGAMIMKKTWLSWTQKRQ